MGLLVGIAVVFLAWYALKTFQKADPRALAALTRKGGGLALLGIAGFLLLRGAIEFAVPVGWFGLGMLGYGNLGLTGFGRRTTTRPGATSQVRSRHLDMRLDHETGVLSGTIISGRHAGTTLDALPQAELVALFEAYVAGEDPEGARLLEAYLDRRFAGWREHAHGHANAGPRRQPQSGAMTEEEAYQVLGLEPGAGLSDIKAAHRTLMKKLHPDQGGSTYLAARVNQAKDVLMSRHR